MPFGEGNAPQTSSPLFELAALARRRVQLIAGTTALVLCAVIAYLAFLTPTYRAMVEIFVEPQALQVVGRGLTRTDTAASIEFAGIDSQALVLTSTSLLEQVIADLHLDQDPVLIRGNRSPATTTATVLDALRQRLVVRRVDASLVFQITVSHPIAAEAARIANAVAAAYFTLGSQDRTKSVRRASMTLIEQSSQLREDLAKADAAVERFKAEAGLISTGESGLIVSQQLKDLYTQISANEANLPRLAARRNQLKAMSAAQIASAPGEAGATPEAILSPVIGALRAQYAAIVQNEAQLARTLGERHPDLANAREQRRAVLEQIQNELARIAKSSDEEYRRAQESLGGLRKQAATLVNSQIASNEAQIKLRQLESEASAIRTVYDASVGRVKELQQQQQIETNNSRIISQAMEPLRPFGTPKALALLAGGLFGAVLGFVLAYVVEFVGGVVPTARAVAALARAPVVAQISRAPHSGERSVEDGRELACVAQDLQSQFHTALPAIVALVGPDAEQNARIADDLTETLVRAGEVVLRCEGGLGDKAVAATRFGLPKFQNKGGLLVRNSTEFALVTVGSDLSDAALAATEKADAILVVVEPGRVTTHQIETLFGILDHRQEKRRAGRIGLICLQPAPWNVASFLPSMVRLPARVARSGA